MAGKLDDRSRATARNDLTPVGAAPRNRRLATQPGDTLPPTPLAALAATGGADLIVLSTDAGLIDTATRASREQLTVWPVATWNELETALSVTRRAVVLVDAELFGKAARARIATLDVYSHKIVTLIAAERSLAQGLMGFLSERKIHRLLIKPPALGITRLLIDSAVARCLKLAEAAPPREQPVAEQAHAPERRRTAAMPHWVLACAGAALLAGVVVIASVQSWLPAAEGERAPLPAEAAPLDAAVASVDTEATLASVADDQRALDRLYADAEKALLANSYAAASTALAEVRRVEPTSGRLAFLEAQLERARRSTRDGPPAVQSAALAVATTDSAVALLASARSALAAGDVDRAGVFASEAGRLGADAREVARLDSEIVQRRAARTARQHAEWLALAGARTRQGALVAPVDDNALHYLSMLQQEAPRLPGLEAAWAAFARAQRERVAAALAAGDWAAAEEGLTALEDVPGGSAASEPLRAQLEMGKLQERYLAVAAPASELELVDRAAPVYPPEAVRAGTEGWVDVELVVDRMGRTRDLEVVAAEPEGQFESAALAALGNYRYRPFAHDGRLFERRIRLRMRFTLE